ncbi:MAG TPA: ribose 5-phosphate isomerase B [Nitrospiraceae bacterium]|nr:ribose 5-phosphate isomerase B [Nitrospiraceae bacterium]
MKLAISCDHGGWELKEQILEILQRVENIDVIDYGTMSRDSVDYPDYAREVSEGVAEGTIDRGILICGTGIGMSIVANRYRNIRAALCNDIYTARMSRLHNNANILVLGGRVVGPGLAGEIVKTWLETEFEGGRHQKRLDKIAQLEKTVTGEQ